MKFVSNVLRRRVLVAGVTNVVIGHLTAPAGLAATMVGALDAPALTTKIPAGVLLVAITLTPGNHLVAVGEHGVIIYSSDNGISWTQASVPVNVTLTCVNFATSEIGWAAGHFGVVLYTQDGGRTWVEQLNGLQVNKLTMQAAQDPSVVSNPSPGAPVAVRRAQHFIDDGPDKPFLTMIVLNTRKILAFGAYRMAVMSDDGGKTWQDWSLHIYDKFSHNIYAALTTSGASYLVAEEGLMFRSTDGNNTFLPLPSPGRSTMFGMLSARDGSLIVFGVAGFAARSTDLCKTWAPLTIATEQDLTGGRVLASSVLILVDESGVLFESIDNGATFAAVKGIQPQPFFDVQQAADGGLIAVGAVGVTQIAKSLLAS